MRKIARVLHWMGGLCLVGAALGCGSSESTTTSTGTAERGGVDAAEVVHWPELKTLDETAEKAEAFGKVNDFKALRALGGEVKANGGKVADMTPPANAHDKAKVKILQGDLHSLVASITDPATMKDDEVTNTIGAVHPIVEELMEASGMPHVHDAPPAAGDGAAGAATTTTQGKVKAAAGGSLEP